MSNTEEFTVLRPDFEQALRDFVFAMPVARFYGFHFARISPGYVETVQPHRTELGHQDGYFQGSVIGAIADFAGAPAAFTLLAAGWETLCACAFVTTRNLGPSKDSRPLP